MVDQLMVQVTLNCVLCLDLMQIDPQVVHPGDEADVESEGGTVRRKSKSQTPMDSKATPEPEIGSKKTRVESLDDDKEGEEMEEEEEEEGDEETYAVEKVLNHRIKKKANVARPYLCFLYSDRIFRALRASNIISNGSDMINNQTIPGKMKKIAKDQSS
jgi:hypothetical protein